MKVQEAYQRANLAIEGDASVRAAAIRMNNHATGSLAVYRDGEMIAILTERDIVRALAEAADITTAVVEDFMTSGVVTVTPDADLVEAAGLMTKLGARHLPVVDDSGHMMGMLSARDLVTILAADGSGFD